MANLFVRFLVGGLAILVAVGYKNYRDLSAPGKRPDLDNNAYWGPALKGPYRENKAILPFDISVKPEVSYVSSTTLSLRYRYNIKPNKQYFICYCFISMRVFHHNGVV